MIHSEVDCGDGTIDFQRSSKGLSGKYPAQAQILVEEPGLTALISNSIPQEDDLGDGVVDLQCFCKGLWKGAG